MVGVPSTIAPTDQEPDDRDPGGRSDSPPDAPHLVESTAGTSEPLAGLERAGDTMVAGRPRHRLDIKVLAASFGIAIGLVIAVLGVLRSVTGREQQGLPDAIENIDPIQGATQVPQQTRVFIDLLSGYEATMSIDGTLLEVFSLDSGDVDQQPPALGGDQEEIIVPPGAIYEPGNNTLTFAPGPSQPIEAFGTGVHTVTIRYWLTTDGPDRFRTFNWTFYVV